MSTSAAPVTAAPVTAGPVPAATDLASLAKAVEAAMLDVKGMPIDHRTRAIALKESIEAFHKAGLTTIVRTLKADPRGMESRNGEPLFRLDRKTVRRPGRCFAVMAGAARRAARP